MKRILIERLPRIEGNLRVVLSETDPENLVHLESGRSLHTKEMLVGKYPLESIELTQRLSAKSSVAHAIASVMALENYLQLDPTPTALQIRNVLIQLSTLYSHIHHFYWEVLPEYLNATHFKGNAHQFLKYYIGYTPLKKKSGDLSKSVGQKLISKIPMAFEVLNILQKVLTLPTGKFPVIMNMIPGGLTNPSFNRVLIMEMVRYLEGIKFFVEEEWPGAVKLLIQNRSESVRIYKKKVNLLSFGSLPSGTIKDQYAHYSDGVLIDGKLEPVNELKITESLDSTYFLPFDKITAKASKRFDLKKEDARTWLIGARYDTETMLTGALSRMLVTHFGGGNLGISDRISQMLDDLGLTTESPNCIATRLLAEVFEGRLYLKSVMGILLDVDVDAPLNRKTPFDFSNNGTGVGKIESPGGALLHQVYIDNNKITQYRIVSPVNWNFSPSDASGKMGIVETELNKLLESEKLSLERARRILYSYNTQILDGTH